MKKIIALVLALLMCMFVFAACGEKEKESEDAEKEKLVVGYTIYAPMNYLDENEKLVGFDTELAEAVAKKLDMEIEFKEIVWGNKYIDLDSNRVNCLWNGFTSNCADDDGIQRSEKVDFSYAYMVNSQCVVVKKSNLTTLNTEAALANKKGAAENGSAGAGVVTGFVGETNLVGVDAQTGALSEVLLNRADFAVIDLTMAKSMVGTGAYSDLAIVESIEIPAEEYSIGFKKGSPLTAKVNGALKDLAADGTMTALAEKYGLSNYVITDLK